MGQKSWRRPDPGQGQKQTAKARKDQKEVMDLKVTATLRTDHKRH